MGAHNGLRRTDARVSQIFSHFAQKWSPGLLLMGKRSQYSILPTWCHFNQPEEPKSALSSFYLEELKCAPLYPAIPISLAAIGVAPAVYRVALRISQRAD